VPLCARGIRLRHCWCGRRLALAGSRRRAAAQRYYGGQWATTRRQAVRRGDPQQEDESGSRHGLIWGFRRAILFSIHK
jgi:hypothetical protein